MIKNFFSRFFALIGSFLTLLMGRISWKCPTWLTSLNQKAMAQPKRSLSIIGGALAVVIIGTYTYDWYKALPKPQLITASITAPKITPAAKTLVPDVLILDFGLNNGTFNAKSVAPLKSIGKEVTEGISMTPAMPGHWVWQTDSRLVFTPTQDWPADQLYTIHFNKKVFASTSKFASLNYTFKTQTFAAKITEFKFYQDPVNPKIRQAVATVDFNYPVDSNSFENKTTLTMQGTKKSNIDLAAKKFKLTFTYDENKRTAYIHSESLPIPDTTRFLRLTLTKDIKTMAGNSVSANEVYKHLVIPDAASYFKVDNTGINIVRNEQGRPEQILMIETTLGVTNTELAKGLHAYLLPQAYPATADEAAKPNYEWANPGEVSDTILKSAAPLDLKTIPAERDFATLHSYKLSAPAGRYVYIKLDKGISGFGDFKLAQNYLNVLHIPEYPKEISFLHHGALLALNSEKKLSVLVRGVPAVKFQIARILPDNVNQLITQTQGDFNNPKFINESFTKNNISEIFTDIKNFDNDPTKAQYTALDIGQYLATKTNTAGPKGLFLLDAIGWDPIKKESLATQASRLILITDLGLLTKNNSDGSHDIFVQSITTGTPVAQATVAILGKNGLPVLTRITDAQGHANFPTLKDFTDEREPTVYTATLGNDVSFIPYNNADRQLNFSRFDIEGVYNNPELQTLSAYLFSDRGIYRPGDTAHIGMIVKQAYAQPQPAGLPLEATITDPKGATVQDQKFTLDATGYLAIDFATLATSPTGQYSINLFIVKDNHPDSLLGSASIRVADFQPDRMRITSHLSAEQAKGWISPKDLTAKVNLWNLYGAPATERKITAKIVLAPQRIQFAEYPNYTFVDPLFDPKKPQKVFTDNLADTQTNSSGEAEFDLHLDRFDKATYELTFSTEGFEAEGGRSVATQSAALVSPLDYFVGYKADGDLSYIKQNSQRSVNIIAINPQLKQQKVSDLKVQLAALHPISTLVKNNDGTFAYQSLMQTNIVSTTSFAINEKGTDYTLPTQQIGDYIVTILDKNNIELSKFKFSVAGDAQLPLAKNAELSVKLNKTTYNADEDIELQITAPYTGAGLVTIERDKVYATQWFKTNATNSIQKIHIPKDFQGNGYVNVAFVRDWDSPEIFISPLSYSVVPFSVNHSNHAIKIDLTTPEIARPGEPFVIKYKSDKPGKVIVFAVDEGILQVAHYKTPDPLGYFFQKHALEVLTQQTVDQILPKFIQDRELSTVGGDGGEEALRNHLNPFKRKTDLPVVFWSGIVDIDSADRELTYQVPDYFNGTLHVMAVAVATDAIGAAEKNSNIRGDFVINPNVPTFVAPNDEFEITASVANNVKGSGKHAKINIQLTASDQLKIIDNSVQTVEIDENQEKTVHYKVRAKDILGSAQFSFMAHLGDKSSKMDATLSVRPATEYFTTVTSGTTEDSKETLTVDRSLYAEDRSVEAAISSNPLIMIVGLQRYLDNFPFGCTEQLVSKTFPLVVVGNQPWFIANAQTAAQKIETTIHMLGQRQLSSGGFSYWPNVGEYNNNNFASVYAMHFLTEAKAQGYTVPSDMFHSGLTYLKELAQQDVTNLDEARTQAYAIYILTRNEIVTTNYLTNLQVYLGQDKKHLWHQDIITAYIAATYQLLKSNDDANKLIGLYKPNKKSTDTSDFYNENIADAQYLYLLARHFPERLQKSGSDLVMQLVQAMNSTDINTILSSYTSLALNAYGQSFKPESNTTLSMTEILANGDKKVLPTQDAAFTKAVIDLDAKKIIFNNPAKKYFFYQLTQSGFDKKLLTSPVKNKIEIEREYRDLTGKAIERITLGSEIEVHITVRSLTDNDINNIAIVDLLPGGFEVVNDSVKTDNMEYADTREDRVIFFGSLSPTAKEIVYHIKAINTGKFTVPPVFAESMYNPNISAHSAADKITVIGPA